MNTPRWLPRFFESTRGRVLQLLRRGTRSVDEMAGELSLTDNAVRSHLSALERDGLVRSEGVRRSPGAGKPAQLYALAADAEPLFSSAYVPLTLALVDALAERSTLPELKAIMRDAGVRLAELRAPGTGDSLRARADAAAATLNDLGGLTEVVTRDGRLRIEGNGCPLSAVVKTRPEVCSAVGALVSSVTGETARVCCDHTGERPSCRFELVPRKKAAGR